MWWLLLSLIQVRAVSLPEQTQAEYTRHYDSFREKYAEYLLQKNQYQKIPTFAHEEALVTAAQSMLTGRDAVWLAYWQALRMSVSENRGLTDPDRNGLTDRIIQEQTELETHQQTLAGLKSRADLVESAQSINQKKGVYEAVGYSTLGMLQQARLTYAIRELQAFAETLRAAVAIQIREVPLREARLRGIDEAQTLLDKAANSLEVPALSYEAYLKSRQSAQHYQKQTDAMKPVYADIVTAANLLRELANEIEL